MGQVDEGGVAVAEKARRVTIADVAARAGVSRALVSIVLRDVPGASPANREKVLRAAADLDYHPDQRARLLGAARSRTLGVVYDLHQPFHSELLDALYAAMSQDVEAREGWRMALEPTAPSRSEATAVQALLDQRCEALLLLGPSSTKVQLNELSTRLPVVVLARSVRGANVDVVRTDDEAGARLATEHLLHLGHRRIVHLHGGRAPGAAERRAGYRAAMRNAGLQPELLGGGLGESDGEAAALHLLRPDRPDAVFAFNDTCAAGFLTAARASGTPVPEQLSLIGYDDSAVAKLSAVCLTTVGQDAMALAGHTIRRAIARTENPQLPTTEAVITPRLVPRRTTAAPTAAT